MFSTTPRSTRRVRILSSAVAAGAMIAAFTFSASSASAVVGGGEPVEDVAPSITGSALVGNTLTGNIGTWHSTDASTVSYSYEWTDDQNTQLSNELDYEVPASEAGRQLTFTVTASDATDDNSDSASTGTVPAVDFHNLTPPVLTGGTVVGDTLTATNGTWSASGLTFTYDWGLDYGQSGDQTSPADPTNTHVVTLNDLGGRLVVDVYASDATGTVLAQAETSTVAIPAPPVADDSGLTAANQGGVTGSQTKTEATVVLPAGPAPVSAPSSGVKASQAVFGVYPGESVYVYGYSSPTPIDFFTVSATNTITVPLGSLSKGLHKLAIVGPDGTLIGWMSVTAGGGLASTGANVDGPLELGGAGVLILLGILSVVFVTRRRQITA